MCNLWWLYCWYEHIGSLHMPGSGIKTMYTDVMCIVPVWASIKYMMIWCGIIIDYLYGICFICIPSRERIHIPPKWKRKIIDSKVLLTVGDMWSFPGGYWFIKLLRKTCLNWRGCQYGWLEYDCFLLGRPIFRSYMGVSENGGTPK